MDLARRFLALPPERRRVFLHKLAERGIDFSQLPIPGGAVGDGEFPLSPVQQGLWFLAQLAPESAAYHVAGGLRLQGEIHMGALRKGFEALAERHDMLRTTFHARDGRPNQRVHEHSPILFSVRDAAGLSDAQTQAMADDEVRRPFDLETGPLWRVSLMARGGQCHELTLCLHHLIADGWSLNRLLAEFALLYTAAVQERDPCLPPLSVGYGHYAVWQRAWLDAGEAQRQLEYWKRALGEAHPIIELPADHPRPHRPSHRGARAGFALNAEIGQALQRLARESALTPFMVLLAGFCALLYRYTGQGDLRIGVPVANRSRSEMEGVVGYCVNTVVFRIQLNGRLRVEDLLQRVKQTALEAQSHAELPFEQLVDALKPERELGLNPLFQVLFNHQQRDFGALARLPGLTVESLDRDNSAAQFDLSLDTEEDRSGNIRGVLTYAADLFEPATAQRLCAHYVHLLRELIAHPGRLVSELSLWTDAGQADSARCDAAQGRWPETEPVHALIRRNAQARPEAPALVCGAERLSYGDLEAQANRLAHRLPRMGLRPEAVVGIALHRSARMIPAMLGVLKAGAAFLPMDPELPQQRMRSLLDDAGAALVLTESALLAKLGGGGTRLQICLDEEDLSAEADTDPGISIHPEQLAYLVYTSGSTGKPKGVAVGHGPLAAHCLAVGERYGMTAGDRALHFAGLGFDAAMEQWMTPLIYGACLVVRGPELWGAEQAFAALASQGVTWFEMPPAYLAEIAQWALAQGKHLDLRACSVGGEAVSREGLEIIRRAVGEVVPVINGYGPTETVITPLVWTAHGDAVCGTAYAPIGTPVGDRSAHVLDGDLNVLPVGAVGELYIGGRGLARGYRDRPALTAERFIPDPFGPPGSRLYRTGDRVRLGADGNVEYLGRVDHQLKLRGFRIEPGEIEAQLLRHGGVSEALVLLHGEGSGKRLLAYVAADGVEAEALKEQLRECLPEYMVPARIVVLERLPKLLSGKVDRKALPEPQWTTAEEQRPPSTDGERRLAEVWAEALKVERVGVDDNFFELGGDSILSLQVVSRARSRGMIFNPTDLFRCQSVSALARVMRLEEAVSAAVAPAQGALPLTPIQAAFFDTAMPRRHHWNLSLLLESRESLDDTLLERAVAALVGHHDSLRLRYRWEEGRWLQRYGEPGHGFLWRRTAADAAGVEAIAQEAQRSLDLSQGPLLHAAHIRLADGSERLLLVVHHLVVDGVSWRILLEDLHAVYRQLREGKEPRLPPRTSSYQAWAECLEIHAREAALAAEIGYWERQPEGGAGEIPRDFAVECGRFREAREITVRLDAGYTGKLLREAPAAYRTRINDLLLAALARVLGGWSGRNEVAVELEGHGREDVFPGLDLSRSVGWFTCQFPVRITAESDPGQAIKTVKEQLRQVPRGGIGYGVLKHLAAPELRARLEALPRPRVGFNYFGQLDENDGLFRPAPESGGADHDGDAPLDFWLEINGQVWEGELGFRWRFSTAMYREETVCALAERYLADLKTLIDHCLSGAAGVTPSDFPLSKFSQSQLDALPLDVASLDDLYPASPMQQGLLFHALFRPEDRTYVNQLAVTITGLDEVRFAAAWQEVTRRHAILRTAFLLPDDAETPVQAVYQEVALPLEVLDHSAPSLDEAGLTRLAAEEHRRGFDLATPPLQRLLLVRLPGGRYRLIWTSHHLLLDGWSTSLLLGEVLALYGGRASLTAPPRFRDYIDWVQQRDAAVAEGFWRSRLATLEEPMRLADALTPPGLREEGLGNLRLEIDTASSLRLKRFAESERITLNTLIQGAWALLLQRYTGGRTVCFGVTVAGRPADLPGAERMLGLFINTLPLLATPISAQGTADWLRHLQADNAPLHDYGYVPLYDIQRWHGQEAQPGSGQELFDSLVVFENYPIDEALRNATGEVRFGIPAQIDDTHYPMTLSVVSADSLHLNFGYLRSCFDEPQVQALSRHFERLLLNMAESPDRPLGLLSPLSAVELEQCHAWNAPPAYPFRGPVHEHIRRLAESQPAATALTCARQTLSYGELERRANRLAHRLLRLGVKAEQPVGIAIERSIEMVIAALAVLKAGGAYLPLDPDAPVQRMALMLEDSDVQLVLTRSATNNVGPAAEKRPGCRVLRVDAEDLSGEAETAPCSAVHPLNLAYLIYTSGSTGRPKGVAVAHGPLAMHCQAIAKRYRMQPNDRALLFATFGFDAAVEQWLVPLMHGASLVLREAELWSAADACEALMREKVTWFDMPPGYLAEIAQWALARGSMLPVRACTVGGEALTRESLELIRRFVGAAPVINGYGPTEAVITPMTWEATADTCCESAYAPIGSPVGDRTAWVLDSDLNPVPVGVAGELYLGGLGLARGYHRSSVLTAERFLPDPFGAAGSRLYRTGDRVRRRPDGVVEYLGRVDQQIKIRGFRIEPGEIESQLLSHARVSEAAVTVCGEGSAKRLVAYVAADEGLESEALKSYLQQRLPDYMVPVQIVPLVRLPRLPSGKLDRRALPDAQWLTRSYAPPESTLELALAGLWEELLGIERVGRSDDFFELGGHSLLAMKLAGRIRQSLGVEISLRLIFEAPQLAAQALAIEPLLATSPPADLEREMASALEELHALTPEDLEALLAAEKL